jgi:hypothetical protein
MRVHLARRTWSSVGASALFGLALLALPMAVHAQAAPPLKLSVTIQRQATGPVITITGSNFTPNGAVKLTGSPPPNTSQAIAFGPIKADATGAFSVRKEMQCTSPRSTKRTRAGAPRARTRRRGFVDSARVMQ